MAETVWYRSLYWRIALGFILFLTSVLVIQGALILWLFERSESVSGPPPRGFTRSVAADLSAALAADPNLDLARYLRDTYQRRSYPFFVLMRDGRLAGTGTDTPPDELVDEARDHLERTARPRFGPGGPEGRSFGPPPPRGFDPFPGAGPEPRGMKPPPPFGPGGPPRGPGPLAEIIVDTRVVGVVSVAPRSSLAQWGPFMALVGVGLVAGATALASFVIFGPVRRRLRSLEEAAVNVGAGNLGARAREDGGDEVAGLAAAFNHMAHDLEVRAQELQAADRARRLLLADVSHELRTPLTAMRGYLETLSMPELTLDATARARYVGIVSEETRRLEHIIGDLLDLAKLEGGGDSLELQDVPIENLFGRVVARHERDAAARRITLASSIAPGAEIVIGDALRLEQALQNLAANAVRHTPAGGRVELGAELADRHVVLTVRDSGPGIPAEHLPLVFDRFYKADASRTHDTAGSGLGLSIVKAIVERHGGTITVSSSPEKGSLFMIRLPAGSD
ncbi:MAG TPA: ATP-binding protein [Vicinamibacterales bacterium]|jgi:signal transduction histidine kinase